MLVDAMNHRIPDEATATTVLGPFYVENPPEFPQDFDISRNLPGGKLFVQANVWSAADGPLANAVIDVWESDTDRFYDVQRDDLHQPTLRGRFRADSQGRLYFWSILPSPYPISNDSADGHKKLIPHLFVQGDRYLDSDAVFGVKNSLIGEYTQEPPGAAPDGTKITSAWRKLRYNFGLKGLR